MCSKIARLQEGALCVHFSRREYARVRKKWSGLKKTRNRPRRACTFSRKRDVSRTPAPTHSYKILRSMLHLCVAYRAAPSKFRRRSSFTYCIQIFLAKRAKRKGRRDPILLRRAADTTAFHTRVSVLDQEDFHPAADCKRSWARV
jgi:hypothetical protein